METNTNPEPTLDTYLLRGLGNGLRLTLTLGIVSAGIAVVSPFLVGFFARVVRQCKDLGWL